MFGRGVLFVGAGRHDLSLLAEAVALDYIRRSASYATVRFYAATCDEAASMDPVLVRALNQLELDGSGLSPKPFALYEMAGAPSIHHVIALGPPLSIGDIDPIGAHVETRYWECATPPEGNAPPGSRYAYYVDQAQLIRARMPELIDELLQLNTPVLDTVAASA